jgi:transposase InsO family protein
VPARTPQGLVEAIAALRRLRMTAAEIAELLGLALSTVSGWLHRIGLGKRSRLAPPEPPNRYERARPGELVHVDIKQLGRISERGAGWRMVGHRGSQFKRRERGPSRGVTRFEYVHVMIDDHSRVAYAEVLDALNAEAAIGFLRRALAWFAERGVRVERVMTDNGSAYVSHAHRQALRALGIRHLTTRPYRPRTNGKAERFIQTLLNESAYARIYASSPERTGQLATRLERHNYRRPHGSLGHQPPATRINNPVGNYRLPSTSCAPCSPSTRRCAPQRATPADGPTRHRRWHALAGVRVGGDRPASGAGRRVPRRTKWPPPSSRPGARCAAAAAGGAPAAPRASDSAR